MVCVAAAAHSYTRTQSFVFLSAPDRESRRDARGDSPTAPSGLRTPPVRTPTCMRGIRRSAPGASSRSRAPLASHRAQDTATHRTGHGTCADVTLQAGCQRKLNPPRRDRHSMVHRLLTSPLRHRPPPLTHGLQRLRQARQSPSCILRHHDRPRTVLAPEHPHLHYTPGRVPPPPVGAPSTMHRGHTAHAASITRLRRGPRRARCAAR